MVSDRGLVGGGVEPVSHPRVLLRILQGAPQVKELGGRLWSLFRLGVLSLPQILQGDVLGGLRFPRALNHLP